ncbi:MAG: hypothetical protein NTY47_00075, partial [Candidatus Omnitrophica bacterium]|nr:hypothetical protein [Candidatus Omnitrophota bacterium]
ATLAKQARKSNPAALLVDSGAFFSGGVMDEYTQNSELDKERSRSSLAAMNAMKYDAVAIGDEEFDFGKEFLIQNLKGSKIAFLACNIKSDYFLPFIIKEINSLKVGIIGLSNVTAQKTEGLTVAPVLESLKDSVQELKKQKVDLIILLSHRGETEDLKTINEVPGIDILVVGNTRSKEETFEKIGSTLVLRPSWQGKHFNKVTLNISGDKKIANYKVDDLRLEDKVPDDKEIKEILPQCFSESNCKKEGMKAACSNPGTSKAECVFSPAPKVSLLVVLPKNCLVCQPVVEKYLKKYFKGLTVSYLFYPDAKALKLIKDFGLATLPAYLISKDAAVDKSFESLKTNLEEKGDYYMLKPSVAGMSYFLDRKKEKSLDLFISLFDKDTRLLLDMVKEYDPRIHFVAVEENSKFDAAKGSIEVQEDLRGVCIEKYYPQYFWKYISCRAADPLNSWWDDCIPDANVNKIKS